MHVPPASRPQKLQSAFMFHIALFELGKCYPGDKILYLLTRGIMHDKKYNIIQVFQLIRKLFV